MNKKFSDAVFNILCMPRFLSLRYGTCLLHVPVLRPASRTCPMHDLLGGTSIVLHDTIRLTWRCVLSVDAARPLFFLENSVYKG